MPINPYGDINPYEDKKANCRVSVYKGFLSLMGTIVIIRILHIIKRMQIWDKLSSK